MTIAAGYMGLLNGKIRCQSFSVNATQDILFYNHVYGLTDQAATGDNTKKNEKGKGSYGRNLYRPSVASIGGSFSFPATDISVDQFYEEAKLGKATTVDFLYYCSTGGGDSSVSFTDALVGGYEFNCQAGEPAVISVTVGALGEKTGTSSEGKTTAEKIMTWDKVSVTTTGVGSDIRGVSFKINNNLTPIYTNGPSDLLPKELRFGTQEVSGSISYYLRSGQTLVIPKQETSKVKIVAGNLTITATVMFLTAQTEGAVGPIVTELPFIGVGKLE